MTLEYTALYDYALVLGKAACQPLVWKNSEAWRRFLQLPVPYYSADSSVTGEPSSPEYLDTRDESDEGDGHIRTDRYEQARYEDESELESGVGDEMENRPVSVPRGVKMTPVRNRSINRATST